MHAGINIGEYEAVAVNSTVFKGVEIDLMGEILKEWQKSPGNPYTLLELRDGKTLAAFALLQKTAGRNFTFDIRFLVLDRDYQNSTAMQHLLALIDSELLKKIPFAVIRLEISSRKRDSLGEHVLEDAGYQITGHISKHFGEDDDYLFYLKAIFRNPPNFILIDKPFSEELPAALPVDDTAD